MHKVYRRKDLREHLVAKMYGQKFDLAKEPNEEPKRSHLKSRLKVINANVIVSLAVQACFEGNSDLSILTNFIP